MPRNTRSRDAAIASRDPSPEPKVNRKGKGKAVTPPKPTLEEEDYEGDGEEEGYKAAGAERSEDASDRERSDVEDKAQPPADPQKSIETYYPPGTDLSAPLYKPRGKWEWTLGKHFEEVEAIHRLSHGAQAEVWYNSAVVDGSERFDYIAKRWNIWNEWRGFFSEIYLYASSQHLRTLQGDTVPNFIGIHNVLGGFVSFAMEPLSLVGWNEASNRLPMDLKDNIVEAFQKIHGKGVLHNDVELRHMLISDDGTKVQIIDFQESRSLNPCTAVGLRACTQEDIDNEMKKVKELIDYDGSMAVTRRRTNRTKRNYRRRVRRELEADTFTPPEFMSHIYWKPTWFEDLDDISDDEVPSDAEWTYVGGEENLMLEPIENEALERGRRFNVPTEEIRQWVRDEKSKIYGLMDKQREGRMTMEAAEAEAKATAGADAEAVADVELQAEGGPSSGPSAPSLEPDTGSPITKVSPDRPATEREAADGPNEASGSQPSSDNPPPASHKQRRRLPLPRVVSVRPQRKTAAIANKKFQAQLGSITKAEPNSVMPLTDGKESKSSKSNKAGLKAAGAEPTNAKASATAVAAERRAVTHYKRRRSVNSPLGKSKRTKGNGPSSAEPVSTPPEPRRSQRKA